MKRIFLIGLCVGINGIKSAENARVIPEIVVTTPEEQELQKELAGFDRSFGLLKVKLSQLPNISSVSSRSSSGKDSSLYERRGASPFLPIPEDQFVTGPLYTKKDLAKHEEKILRQEEIKKLQSIFNDVWSNNIKPAIATQQSASSYGPRIVNADGSRLVSTHGSRPVNADGSRSTTNSSRSTSAAGSRSTSTDAQRARSAVFFLGSTAEEDEEEF